MLIGMSALEKLIGSWAWEAPKNVVVRVNLEGPEPVQTEFSALLGLPVLMGIRNKWGNCRYW